MGKFDSKNLLFIILLCITVVAIGVTVWAVWFRTNTVLPPDYAPQKTEGNAEKIEGDDDEKMESPEGGGAVSIIYADTVNIDLSEKKASLLFGNPLKSNQDMVVQLVIQDEILIQSGLIIPGYQIKTLELLSGAEKKLMSGGYDGKLVVLCYDRESGERAVVNTEILVTVTVTE